MGTLDNLIRLESAPNDQPTGYKWLVEQGYASRTEYLAQLRIIKSQIDSAIKKGWLVDTTPSDECRPDNPHHFHNYSVTSKFIGRLEARANMKPVSSESVKEIATGEIFDFDELEQIWLGHPCGDFIVFDPSHVNGSYLPLSLMNRFSINLND